MYGKNLSGRNLADLAEEISTKDVPVLKSAYTSMCDNECNEALQESEDQFKEGLDAIGLPIEQDEDLTNKMNLLEQDALKLFDDRCNGIETRDEVKNKLKTRIDEHKALKLQSNTNIKAERAIQELT